MKLVMVVMAASRQRPGCYFCLVWHIALQRWEQHNLEEQHDQQQRRRRQRQFSHQQQLGAAVHQPVEPHTAAAAEAMDRWKHVSRGARAALKKANVQSVMELEMQVLQLRDQVKGAAAATSFIEQSDVWCSMLAMVFPTWTAHSCGREYSGDLQLQLHAVMCCRLSCRQQPWLHVLLALCAVFSCPGVFVLKRVPVHCNQLIAASNS
jgi:hypothetical protein